MTACCRLALLAGVLTGVPMAAPVDHWFEQANRFYQAEAYDSAEAYYRKVLGAGVENAAVYYNLGNACFRQNRMGEAILGFERALRFAPGDPDIENNLRFAQANIVDRVSEPERGFVESALRAFHTMLSLRTQLWVLTALSGCLAIMIALFLYASRNVRLWLTYLIVLSGAAAAAVGSSAAVKIHAAERVVNAVVLEPVVDAFNAPQGDKVLFVAHEGTTVRIRQDAGEWCLVSLANGVSGWVMQSSLGRI